MNKLKAYLFTILIGAALYAAPFAQAQQTPNELLAEAMQSDDFSWLDCGHCDGQPLDNVDCGDGGCSLDVGASLRYMPYYGIPEVIETTPPAYKIVFFVLILLGIGILFL